MDLIVTMAVALDFLSLLEFGKRFLRAVHCAGFKKLGLYPLSEFGRRLLVAHFGR